ncbi:hypothetical protein IWX49DRAFT_636718 [Phyllosticta citricarpa]
MEHARSGTDAAGKSVNTPDRVALLRLPRELRDIVYHELLNFQIDSRRFLQYKKVNVTLWHPSNQVRELEGQEEHESLSIAETCSQLRAEVESHISGNFEVELDFGFTPVRSADAWNQRVPHCPLVLRLLSRLVVYIPMCRERNPDVFHGARKEPSAEPFSIKHDWTSPREATLVRSKEYCSASEPARSSQRAHDFQGEEGQQPHAVWSRVVSPLPCSSESVLVRDYDLQELYANQIWTADAMPFENVAFLGGPVRPQRAKLLNKDLRHQPWFRFFNEMAAKGHCLRHLEVNLVTMSHGQEDFVTTRPQRPATSDGASHLTRSDYGASPHLHLLSRLDPTIPAVRVNFGFGGLDDDQRSRRFDYALMANWLRRRIEDSDEARALVDFPGCDVMSYDECFPRLPAASTAPAEEDTTVAEALMPVSPLTFEATGLSEEEFCDPRLRLVDDANIVCPFERPSLDDASCGEGK